MSKLYNYQYEDHVAIYPLGDIHLGSPNCNMELVHKYIDGIAEKPDCFCLLLGDLLDMALAGSKSDVYTATKAPGKAIVEAVELLRPLAEQHKILTIMDGNHEERLARIAGISPSEMIANMLGISNLYTPTTALLRFSCDNHSHLVYASHGNGCGGRPGSKINQLEKLSWITDADIIVAGHVHMPAVYRSRYIKLDPKTGVETEKERLFVNCASCLSYDGSYGDSKGYVASSNTYPIIHFFPDREPMVTI